MLFLDENAEENGARLAKIGIEFLEDVFKSDRTGRVQRLSEKIEMANRRFAQIWSDYFLERTLRRALSSEARVLNARKAYENLEVAIKALNAIPHQFLSDFFESYRERPLEFEVLKSEIEEMRMHAKFRDRKLEAGVREDPVVRSTVHAVANLYGDLMERRFPKTFTYADAETPAEFVSPGAEFVRLILYNIDSTIDISMIRTALRSFKVKQEVVHD